jgi:lipoate-protein ligase A
VTTLNHYLPPGTPRINHESFTQAVTAEFAHVYEKPATPMRVTNVNEKDVREPKLWDGVKEMKTWEWEYGSSPEFSNLIEGELSFGTLVSPPLVHRPC